MTKAEARELYEKVVDVEYSTIISRFVSGDSVEALAEDYDTLSANIESVLRWGYLSQKQRATVTK